MGFAKIRDVVDYGHAGGQFCYTSFYKLPTYASLQNSWSDLTMAPGSPKQFMYGGEALHATLFNSAEGIWTGGSVSPATKHISKIMIVSASAVVAPCNFLICDLLLYYPVVDFTLIDQQIMDNTVTLPRYATGRGVRAFLVSTMAYTGGQQFWMEFVDCDGVTRFTNTQTMDAGKTAIGNLVGTGLSAELYPGPFVRDYSGGIRSIKSFKMIAAVATGAGAIVLCRPLGSVMIREATAASEKDFILDGPSLPVVLDGAFVSIIGAPNGNWATVPIVGEITTIWR